MFAGLNIVASATSYRLKKLEMANLAAAVSIAVALRLSWTDIVVRTLFAFVLNVLVYLNNDYIDVTLDLRSPDKDSDKTRYLAEHLSAAFWAQIVLLGLLVACAAVYDLGLLFPLIAGGGICWWYSAYLKRRPGVDILSMMVWGVAMPLCGAPLWSVLGWGLALQLGLFSGVFESIQVVRDADDDAKQEGVKTTGVVLGKKLTLSLARGVMVSSSLYAALILQPWAGLVSAGALFVPFHEDRIEKYWTNVKLVYGITWLFICAWVFFTGHSSGLLWSIGAHARLN